MKKITALTVSLLAASAALAQTESTLKMNVNLKDGNTVSYSLSDIQDITFGEEAPVELPVAFAAPKAADFKNSYVYKVMAGSKKVAEADLEYIKGVGQTVVVYPCDADGKADLTKGIATSGATVAWDASTKLPTVGTGATAVENFYVVDGRLLTAYDGQTANATLSADLLVDTRGTVSETYRLVKIGLQYWTADNLRATKFTDGTDIAGIGEAESDAWTANTTGAYLTGADANWVKIAGHLYNGYCAVSDKIAPKGWRVPTCEDYGSIRTSVGARTASLYKDENPGSWSTGTEGTNATGFSVVATGYFSTATGLSAMYSDAYIWTSDSSYDFVSKGQALDFFRINGAANNATFPTKGLTPHSYAFGHCIRLVRE